PHRSARWLLELSVLRSYASRLFVFFVLLVRPPPSSTLFPYTTLFRSRRRRRPVRARPAGVAVGTPGSARRMFPGRSGIQRPPPRSEEHTSELQSLRHLVCRLLLEKKN